MATQVQFEPKKTDAHHRGTAKLKYRQKVTLLITEWGDTG